MEFWQNTCLCSHWKKAQARGARLRLLRRRQRALRFPKLGGPAGPEPTRYGDWERRGRCIDF